MVDTLSIDDIRKTSAFGAGAISAIPASVGRPKINDEQTPARFPEGTLARIDASLTDGEKRSDFIREAVERELKRRKRRR